jgi:plasmid maintenance system antidote protein VapI
MLKHIKTKELAECLGVTKAYASNIKSGRQKLNPKYWRQVSAKFNITIENLLDFYLQNN